MDLPLHLLLPLLLVTAKLLGVAGRKVGVPAVVGEIFAGLLLGPSLIGALPSEATGGDAFHVFGEFAQIGLCILLFRIGLETDLGEFLRVWRPATSVAIAGMIFPFVLGWGVATLLGWSVMVAVFVGATLTATSIGVTASVLDEIKGQRSAEGRIMLGAAVLDDVLGLLVLSAMMGMVTPGAGVANTVGKALVQALLFMGFGIFFGPLIVRGFMAITRWSGKAALLLVLSFSYMLLMAAVAHAIGLAMIIGAYAAGLAFGGYEEHEELNRDLRPLIDLLTPLFFILIGASMELHGLNPLTAAGRWAWVVFATLTIAAIVGKMLSPAFLKAGNVNRLAIGSGMMPRGEVGFVFAQMGLSVSLYSPAQYSMLTLVLVATTILGPLLLRRVWNCPRAHPSLPFSFRPDPGTKVST